MQGTSLADAAAQLAIHLAEVQGALDAYDEVFRLLRVRLLDDPPPEHLMPTEWLPISEN